MGSTQIIHVEDFNMGLHLGMDVPDWPPENIEELAKRFEDHY